MTAAERLVEALHQLGVELVFGLPGVHNLAIWRSLSQSTVRLVGVRHEQAAVYAADGYARATGRLGVAIVTTGPGAANTLGATGEAMASGSPVLVIATDIPSTLRRPGVYRGVLHETRDQEAMFAPVTKARSTVQAPDAVAPAVLSAAAQALAAPSGPVYLGVPTDLLTREAAAPQAAGPDGAKPPAAPDPEQIEQAARKLEQAHQPVIWAGGGAVRADAGDAIAELATALRAPVITTYMGRGAIAPDHPYAAPSPVHLDLVGELWDEADVVLAIGSDLDGLMTQNWAMPAPPALIAINVDPADATKNYPAQLVLVGDARNVTAALNEEIRPREDDGIADRLSRLRQQIDDAIRTDEPQAHELLHAIEDCLPEDAIVVADMCIPGYWLGGFHRVRRPRKLAYPMGWGTLGFGFPASIGTALARCGTTVCVTGDGGFLFACGELATVVQENVPVTIVLVDDGGYGMLRYDQVSAGEEPYGVDLAGPDFASLAAAFGLPAQTVTGFGAEFREALTAAVATPAPSMVVVEASLKPPPNTSPRWYRRPGAGGQRPGR